MKAELQKQLFDKYPKIFRQKDLPMTQTCMCWGIDTGDGWYTLIDDLCSIIQQHVDNKIKNRELRKGYLTLGICFKELFSCLNPRWIGKAFLWKHSLGQFVEWIDLQRTIDPTQHQVEAEQVKEKFGGLRFYVNHSEEFISGVICMAESMSYSICEDCGNPGKCNKSGWLSVLCDGCREKRRTAK
jgi:hypothetical protein